MNLISTKLKNDLVPFPEVPIPNGCPLVHPMLKDPVRWVSLSKKVKADLYHNKFLEYLENWKKGEAGKHAASAISYPTYVDEDDPEWAAESAALDAELAKTMASWDNVDDAA